MSLLTETKGLVMLTVAPCGWLVQDYDEDGLRVDECGAEAYYGDDGFYCVRGHSHVNAEARFRQGWDYDDEGKVR